MSDQSKASASKTNLGQEQGNMMPESVNMELRLVKTAWRNKLRGDFPELTESNLDRLVNDKLKELAHRVPRRKKAQAELLDKMLSLKPLGDVIDGILNTLDGKELDAPTAEADVRLAEAHLKEWEDLSLVTNLEGVYQEAIDNCYSPGTDPLKSMYDMLKHEHSLRSDRFEAQISSRLAHKLQVANTAEAQTVKKTRCFLCNSGDHAIERCQKGLSMTWTQWLHACDQKKVCKKCTHPLSPEHAETCRAVCKICKKNHHMVMC